MEWAPLVRRKVARCLGVETPYRWEGETLGPTLNEATHEAFNCGSTADKVLVGIGEVKPLQRDTHQSAALDIVRRPKTTPSVTCAARIARKYAAPRVVRPCLPETRCNGEAGVTNG
jgi:hypothetical protein